MLYVTDVAGLLKLIKIKGRMVVTTGQEKTKEIRHGGVRL